MDMDIQCIQDCVVKTRSHEAFKRRLRLAELQAKQKSQRAPMRVYAATQNDELWAFRNLAVRLFGNADERYPALHPQYGPYRYGGLLEVGPHEPGVIYMGYYIDPPWTFPKNRRRRKLMFVGVKISEIEDQARALFGPHCC